MWWPLSQPVRGSADTANREPASLQQAGRKTYACYLRRPATSLPSICRRSPAGAPSRPSFPLLDLLHPPLPALPPVFPSLPLLAPSSHRFFLSAAIHDANAIRTIHGDIDILVRETQSTHVHKCVGGCSR